MATGPGKHRLRPQSVERDRSWTGSWEGVDGRMTVMLVGIQELYETVHPEEQATRIGRKDCHDAYDAHS